MSKLNPNAQKWVDELRSGKYGQAKRKLRSGNDMCCLGVACDISAETLGLEWNGSMIGGQIGVLPDPVQEWLGMVDNIGSFPRAIEKHGARFYGLAEANDEGLTFDQIADLIEEHAEELFEAV